MTVTITPETAFVFMLVFARLGSMIAAMPALGEAAVSAQVRLAIALLVTLVMLPVVRDSYGAVPGTIAGLVFAMLSEVAVGLAIGVSARLVTSALQVAGTIMAFQTGLAFAQNVDPTQGVQSALMSSFLSMLAATMIFATDLHHLLFAAMRDSYDMFRPGQLLPIGDFAQMAVKTVAGAFKVAIQLAAPFLVFGMIFNLGQGVLSRLMPQVQIFFIAMPANIFLGFVLLMLLISTVMMWYLDHFAEGIKAFIR